MRKQLSNPASTGPARQWILAAVAVKGRVSLPDHRGAAPLFLEKRGDGHLALLDKRLRAPDPDAGVKRAEFRHGACIATVGRAVPGESVEVRHGDVRPLVVTLQVTMAHVINQDQDNVGRES